MDIRTPWLAFKQAVIAHELSISYVDTAGNYYLFTTYDQFQLVCRIVQGTAEATDFENNYKDSASTILA